MLQKCNTLCTICPPPPRDINTDQSANSFSVQPEGDLRIVSSLRRSSLVSVRTVCVVEDLGDVDCYTHSV